MDPVESSPFLPTAVEAGPHQSYLGALLLALMQTFARWSVRVNAVLPKDGSEDMTGDLAIDGNILLPGTTGSAVKLKDFTADTEDYGWMDITSPITIRGVGATDPSWTAVAGGLYAYKFGVGDYVWQTAHIPHSIVPDTPVHFHAHWFTDGTDTGNVQWEFIYVYAKGFDQAAFDFASPTTVNAEEAASGTQYQHMVTESAAETISGLDEPDGIVYYRFGRVAASSDENTDDVFVLTSDLHVQSIGIDSTPGKAPGFYNT